LNSNITHTFALQDTAIQQSALFADISNVDYGKIISAARQQRFLKKRAIFVEGDRIEQVVLLLSGSAKITQIGQTGMEVILRLGRLGDVLGGFGTKERQCCTAETLEDCRALVWDSATFELLANRFPVIRRNVLRILDERLCEIEERFREVSTENAASRLSSLLVRVAKQIGKQEGEGVHVNLSHRELAQLTGTTIFTVSRLLTQWEKEGTVTTRREAVSIRSIPALTAISMKDDSADWSGSVTEDIRSDRKAWE
jgi:CRP-like cAMP-binding protein